MLWLSLSSHFSEFNLMSVRSACLTQGGNGEVSLFFQTAMDFKSQSVSTQS